MHQQPPVEIRAASASEVIDLRHEILRAGLPRETAVFDGDAAPTTRHIVAVTAGGRVVGCATVHLNQWNGRPAWQLRGMATAADFRGRGLGRRMLAYLESAVLAGSPVRQMWCNARVPAAGFYQRLGWRVVSEAFEIPTAGPHVRMTRELPPPARESERPRE
jgi:predicted GNAT family N-acyltransferase